MPQKQGQQLLHSNNATCSRGDPYPVRRNLSNSRDFHSHPYKSGLRLKNRPAASHSVEDTWCRENVENPWQDFFCSNVYHPISWSHIRKKSFSTLPFVSVIPDMFRVSIAGKYAITKGLCNF